MKLDEALQHRWAGVDIRRKAWHPTIANLDHDIIRSQGIGTDDLDADDWEVVPKYVGWDEAWRALQDGNMILINGEGPYIFISPRLLRSKKSGADMNTIPVWWLSCNEIEIVED